MKPLNGLELTQLIVASGTPVKLIGEPNTLVGPDVVIDSRQATPGSLFVAFPGENVDGHDYAAAAVAKGANAAMVTRQVPEIPMQLVVSDVQKGLTDLARGLHRRARGGGLQTVAITGSAGKTSTKDLTHQVLSAVGATVSPIGSFNNEIGTPLTICQLAPDTRFLVLEMGARATGDVEYLCSIAQPDVAMVCNVGTAHIGEFGSQAGIAAAKGEIYEALDADGWAVFNLNDRFVAEMWERTPAHRAGFQIAGEQAHEVPNLEIVVSAENVVLDELQRPGFDLVVQRGGEIQSAHVQLKVIGAHQVPNALAAATAALCLGGCVDVVAAGLNSAISRSPMRMELHELATGAAIINDAYNANPDSMAAGLHTLAAMIAGRRRSNPNAKAIAILGDMLELGETAAELHKKVGELAAELGVSEVIAIGEYAADISAGAGGIARVASVDDVGSSLELNDGDVVLVKASRGLRLERIADALIDREDPR